MEPEEDCENANDDDHLPGVDCLDHDVLPSGDWLRCLEQHGDPCQGAIDREVVFRKPLNLLLRGHTIAAGLGGVYHLHEPALVLGTEVLVDLDVLDDEFGALFDLRGDGHLGLGRRSVSVDGAAFLLLQSAVRFIEEGGLVGLVDIAVGNGQWG